MSYGVWVNDLGWLEESHKKDPKTDTYTSNPSLWPTLAKAKKEATALNKMWRNRTPHYTAKKYKK